VGSARLRRFLDQEQITVEEGEEVDLFITGWSDLGAKAIINGKHEGLIFKSDVFQPLHAGDRLRGYVKNVREDGKIDLRLQQKGYAKVEPNAEKILQRLRQSGGFLPLHDKSDPDLIRDQLQMSKKTFKKAIGGLYKQQLIELVESGIKLKEG
ncbi:MAG: GntR family transcriptional regulator, partial [Bacteroidetes bacterium]|nr:GntR family transcriptional regulator [Bacteroidota bacterium]